MKSVQAEISMVKGRLDDDVESIDDVISLLDYIETLKRQDNKVEEIGDFIEILAKNMDYIESLKIMFPDWEYEQYLATRNWPRSFSRWIMIRRQQLLAQKENLIHEMSMETDNVFSKVNQFKQAI